MQPTIKFTTDRFAHSREKDTKIAIDRLATLARIREEKGRPVLGDYLILPGKSLRRVAHIWGDTQMQLASEGFGSFYLGDGYVEFSGTLEPTIEERYELTGEYERGEYWFFHNGEIGPDRGVHFETNIPVWRVIPL